MQGRPCRACRRQTKTGSERVLLARTTCAAGQSSASAVEEDSFPHVAGVCPIRRKEAFSGSRYGAGAGTGICCTRTASAFRAFVCDRAKTEATGRVFAEARSRGSLAVEGHSQDSAASLPKAARQLQPAFETKQSEKLRVANKLSRNANPQKAVSNPRQRGELPQKQPAGRIDGRAENVQSGSSQPQNKFDVWQVGWEDSASRRQSS